MARTTRRNILVGGTPVTLTARRKLSRSGNVAGFAITAQVRGRYHMLRPGAQHCNVLTADEALAVAERKARAILAGAEDQAPLAS